MLVFDHLVVSGATREAGRHFVETTLGLEMEEGGEHPTFQTHNAVMGLEAGVYLEAIAANPAGDAPSRSRWYDLDRFEGAARLTNWACRTNDLEAALAQFPEAGEILELSRGDLRWRMAVPKTGILPFDNLFPALLQWDVAEIPQDRLVAKARVTEVRISHPWAQALEAMLAPVLEDERVVFEQGAASLQASLDTPGGLRTL